MAPGKVRKTLAALSSWSSTCATDAVGRLQTVKRQRFSGVVAASPGLPLARITAGGSGLRPIIALQPTFGQVRPRLHVHRQPRPRRG
jgi:hypothetical protein